MSKVRTSSSGTSQRQNWNRSRKQSILFRGTSVPLSGYLATLAAIFWLNEGWKAKQRPIYQTQFIVRWECWGGLVLMGYQTFYSVSFATNVLLSQWILSDSVRRVWRTKSRQSQYSSSTRITRNSKTSQCIAWTHSIGFWEPKQPKESGRIREITARQRLFDYCYVREYAYLCLFKSISEDGEGLFWN